MLARQEASVWGLIAQGWAFLRISVTGQDMGFLERAEL